MTNLLTYWFLLILGCICIAIGLVFLLEGNWGASGALFTLALVLVVLVIVTRKGNSS